MDLDPESQRPRTIRLEDYRPPAFLIERVELRFELGEPDTLVEATLTLQRGAGASPDMPLELDGDGLSLVAISIDGAALAAADFEATPDRLRIKRVPAEFELRITTRLRPQDNTELSGLYQSSGNYCTQCEAEGFRRITYFLDRPDVMARYTTVIVAEHDRYPVLLSNGNLAGTGTLEDGRHWARWEDPFPKPSYLFALVAGRLDYIEDHHVTMSGRRVQLFVYVQPHNIDMCGHAMNALKNAMRWDEQVYGREYDLDRYMIVAVDDFNMGAMENKGLNIFNSKYVLARPDTATDFDYEHIEGVIGHEYFHNWSGNRVTCRDWFQLSLKEGFTVFRDQEFSADMGSRAVKRIQDVNLLRTHQFREDAGPMAHPVRPDAYVEINNFYTATVYNKGAEVVRMLHTLLGASGFRRGTDLYFERHDGEAVTTDDFVRAMEDANEINLQQFRRWYSQGGTPVLSIKRYYDADAKSYTLTITQRCPATPGQVEKLPFHIPFAVALLDPQGRELPLRMKGEKNDLPEDRVLHLCEAEQSFVFQGIDTQPVPSLLRGFSAPVRLEVDYSESELCFLLSQDTDPFCRWEAGQQLAVQLIQTLASASQEQKPMRVPDAVTAAFAGVLQDSTIDPAFRALLLTLPSEVYLGEFMQVVDPDALHAARQFVRRHLAVSLRSSWLECYHGLTQQGPYRVDAEAIGQRSLRNLCLNYLMELEDPDMDALAKTQFEAAENMTDVMAALSAIAQRDTADAEQAMAEFYRRWKGEPLVVDKWLTVQAQSRRADTLDRVEALTRHPAFSMKNPNKVYALLRAFAQGNPVRFHGSDGAAYRFIGEQIATLDGLNPQVAARLAGAFNDWRRYDDARQGHQRAVLTNLMNDSNLSPDTYEIISKSLGEA